MKHTIKITFNNNVPMVIDSSEGIKRMYSWNIFLGFAGEESEIHIHKNRLLTTGGLGEVVYAKDLVAVVSDRGIKKLSSIQEYLIIEIV